MKDGSCDKLYSVRLEERINNWVEDSVPSVDQGMHSHHKGTQHKDLRNTAELTNVPRYVDQ